MSQTHSLFPDMKSSNIEWEKRLKFIKIQKEKYQKEIKELLERYFLKKGKIVIS